jgi:hypothetical protein
MGHRFYESDNLNDVIQDSISYIECGISRNRQIVSKIILIKNVIIEEK